LGPVSAAPLRQYLNHLIVAGVEQHKTTDKTSSTGRFTRP